MYTWCIYYVLRQGDWGREVGLHWRDDGPYLVANIPHSTLPFWFADALEFT